MASTLNEKCAEYGITTLLRRAHLIAQLAHESGGFKRLVENLNYSAPRIAEVWPRLKPRAAELARNPEKLANAAYCDRMGNGDEASGDGWLFRGRGWIQLTGRENYRLAGFEDSPESASDPATATIIALDYWRRKKCSDHADLDDVAKVTELINGGSHGLKERRELTERAKTIFLKEE